MYDQDRISPNNSNTISSRQVMRINKNSNQGIFGWTNIVRIVGLIVRRTELRASLCENQTSWEMKIFSTPLQILHAVRHSAEMHINAPFKGRSTLVAMVTTAACSRPGASFSYKNVAKKEWNVYFSISS